MGKSRNAYKILVEFPKGIDHLKNLHVDVRILSKWSSREYIESMENGFH
jgi:hypothetical protein